MTARQDPAVASGPKGRHAGLAAETAPPARAGAASHWSCQHHAWQHAIDSQEGQAGKEPLPAGVVVAIALHRLREIPPLRTALEREPGLREWLEALRPHVRDAHGRNWNVPLASGGTWPWVACEADFRRLVDALRDEFDLA